MTVVNLAGSLRQQKSLTVGGRTFVGDEVDSLITIHGQVQGSAHATLRKSGDAVGYQVPVGKKFVVHAVKVTSIQSGTAAIQMGYGDTDVGQNSASGPTGQVWLAGDNRASVPNAVPTGTTDETSTQFEIPAGKYPFMQRTVGTTDINSTWYGFEVDV